MIPVLRPVAIFFLTLGLLVVPAVAASLDQAKAAGQVGERIDGYVGVVDANAPADVRAMVDQINAERQAKYKEIADKQGGAGRRGRPDRRQEAARAHPQGRIHPRRQRPVAEEKAGHLPWVRWSRS